MLTPVFDAALIPCHNAARVKGFPGLPGRPLVSIKTFAQLLPERYNDSEFRATFSTLIGHEIDRIDSLVNQLLRFARPAKPHLHVHDILEEVSSPRGAPPLPEIIKLTRNCGANIDTMRADSDQLEQVFLNFFI